MSGMPVSESRCQLEPYQALPPAAFPPGHCGAELSLRQVELKVELSLRLLPLVDSELLETLSGCSNVQLAHHKTGESKYLKGNNSIPGSQLTRFTGSCAACRGSSFGE